ncbi:MAG: alpha/beta hydrolase [Pseudomonadota bacterium]
MLLFDPVIEKVIDVLAKDTPSDFCILNGREDARLSEAERLTVTGGAALDRIMARLGKSLASVTLESFAPALDVATLKAQAITLRMLRERGELEGLFSPPTLKEAPGITPIHGFPNGSVFDLEFASHFPERGWPHDPGYISTEENTTSYVRLWEHKDYAPNRMTIVAVHGWTMGDQRVNSLAFLPGLLFSLGCNVALVELPFHGRRRPRGIPEELPLFPSADPVRTCLAMAHALHDLRRLRRFLEDRGHTRVSCVGMSLGAYVGALWCASDKLDRAAFLVPLVSMGDMAFELLRRKGEGDLSTEFLNDLFNDHCPLRKPPATEQSSILVVGGIDDHLVPKTQILRLQSHWPHAKVIWVGGGHAAATNRAEAFDRIARFLTEIV